MVAAVEPVPGLGSCGSACFSTSQPPLPRPAAAFSPSSLGGVVDGALARMLADALDAFDEPAGSAVGARGVRELGSSVFTACIATSQQSPRPSHGAGSDDGLQRRGSCVLLGGSLRPGSRQSAPRRAGSAPLGGGASTASPLKLSHALTPDSIISTSYRAGAPRLCSKPEPEPSRPSPAPGHAQRACHPALRRAGSAFLGGASTPSPPKLTHASSLSSIISATSRADAPQLCSQPEPTPSRRLPAPEHAQQASRPEPAPRRPAPVTEHTQRASKPVPESQRPAPAPECTRWTLRPEQAAPRQGALKLLGGGAILLHLDTGAASKSKGLRLRGAGLHDDYYYLDNGEWIDWPLETARDWWWLLYEDPGDCTGHHGCVWYCFERPYTDPAPEPDCNAVISTFDELLRLERRLRREIDSHGEQWGLRRRPLYRWYAPQTAGEVGPEFIQVSWETFLSSAARHDGSSWWQQASPDGSGWWQSMHSHHPPPGLTYHPDAARHLSRVSTTPAVNGTPAYVPPTKAEQDEVLARELDRVQCWDRGGFVWSEADLRALREKGRAAVGRSLRTIRGITKHKLQQQVRSATSAEGRRRDAAARDSHREQQRQRVASLPNAQTVVSLMTQFMPAEGPAQVVAANTAASNMVAQAQLEDDILQAAIERRLQAKSSAYDTLVYENGNARGGVNIKLRDREIMCLTRDGVPLPAAERFVLGKIASHRERLSANMSPVSEPNDDSDSLPDMS